MGLRIYVRVLQVAVANGHTAVERELRKLLKVRNAKCSARVGYLHRGSETSSMYGVSIFGSKIGPHTPTKNFHGNSLPGGGGVREPPPRGEGSGKHTTQPQTSLQMNTHFTFLSLVFALWQFVYVRYELVGNSDFQVSDRQFYCFIIFSVVTLFFFFLQLTEEILLADHITATCYSPQARKRGRKHRTEATQYNYSKRESWTSTENSLEMRRHGGYSANNSVHSSKEIINLADVRAPLEAKDKSRPPLLHLSTQSISSLSPQAREMAGGQPDYVWESRKVRHPKNNVTNSLWSHSTNSRYKLERGRFFRQSCELPEFAQIETCCKNNNEDPDQSREPVSLV